MAFSKTLNSFKDFVIHQNRIFGIGADFGKTEDEERAGGIHYSPKGTNRFDFLRPNAFIMALVLK